MQFWFRKLFVVLMAIMTLGMYIPSTDITDANRKDASHSTAPNVNKNEFTTYETEDVSYALDSDVDVYDTQTDLTNILTEKAKMQTMKKLGPRITEQLEEEFYAVILPKIETELEMIFREAGEEQLAYFDITENPATGYGERIFNVYDHDTKKDIAKFHVRRDHRPLEGYWFNFHYHLSHDGFEKHHDIGEIYWDKNMPPKWMA